MSVRITPVRRALTPVNSAAAERVSAPNYDEFQSDREVWELLQSRPDNLLRVTMPHCHVPAVQHIGQDGSRESLEHAAGEMRRLCESPLMREMARLMWVYQITSPRRPEAPQMGLGGMASTAQIRTEQQPAGVIIRNEGIHPEKAQGRARLLEAIGADTGFVNLAVKDADHALLYALEAVAASRPCDVETLDEAGNRHRLWWVRDDDAQEAFASLIAREAAAYVADGNHRSAAAASLGREDFLAVFFPVSRMGLEPYNRLLKVEAPSSADLTARLLPHFEVESLPREPYRPAMVHEIGLYHAGQWRRLTVRPEAYDAHDAAQSIDADIVQRRIIHGVFGIADARDKRINYVGGNKDAAWLAAEVDAGRFALALSLAPVTMEQFVAVCEQNKFMPPKSTWFDPKIRTGLVIALLS